MTPIDIEAEEKTQVTCFLVIPFGVNPRELEGLVKPKKLPTLHRKHRQIALFLTKIFPLPANEIGKSLPVSRFLTAKR